MPLSVTSYSPQRRVTLLLSGAATLALGACSTTPDSNQLATAAEVESQFVAALQAPLLEEGDVDHDLTESVTAAGDYWDTGTLASVDDDGNLVYLVPTSLVERSGADAYAGRQGPHNRERDPNVVVTLDPNALDNPLLTPNAVRNNRGARMVLGTSNTQRPQRPQATPAPAPRPTVGASGSSSRYGRASRGRTSQPRQSRD